MSAEQLVTLALRKERLLERVAVQRDQLAAYGAHIEKPLALADRALQAVQYVKARPWIAGVAGLLVVVLGRRNVFRWVGRGWSVWRAARFAQQWLVQAGVLKM
jgi:YqjK-like protein